MSPMKSKKSTKIAVPKAAKPKKRASKKPLKIDILTVTLSHEANRDIRSGYWVPANDAGAARSVPVISMRDARAKCLAYIDRNELGGGNWTGGAVFDNGVQIASISYNGRIWGIDGNEVQIDAAATNACVSKARSDREGMGKRQRSS